MQLGRVLVVDDEPDVRNVCRRGLSQMGFQVVEAGSGMEAVERAREAQFDLLLLDFRMPGMDGLQTYRAIRDLQPQVLGVMMTAHAAVDNAVQAVNLGFSGFVLKPFKLLELQSAVQDALRKRERDREQTRSTVLGSLARVSATLTGQDLDEALSRALQAALEQTRSDSATIVLFANGKGNGAGGQERKVSIGQPLDCHPVVLESALEAEPLMVLAPDSAVPPVLLAALQGSGLHRAALARLSVPQQPMLGVVCVGRHATPEAFTTGDLEALKVLAAQTAVVVSNARLFNQVVEGERLNRSLRSYLSPRTVQAVLNGQTTPGTLGDAEVMTVLLADVVDFSSLVERAEVERIIEVMHQYFSSAVDVISAYQGVVDELSGDEILASFDRRSGRADDALRGVNAGLQMLQHLDKLRADWAQRGMPFFEIGIGISSGPVALGSIGTDERRALVTAGRILNLAARSQALTRQTGLRLIITQGTFEQVREQVQYRELGAIRLKGIAEPVGLYGVYGLVQAA